MGTTPTLLLPYPAASDPADVPLDMQELADRIEAVRGAANGLAGTDSGSKVPVAQLPAGVANGVASLDATGKVPAAQLPAAASNALKSTKAVRATGFSIPNAALTAMQWDNEIFDDDNMFAPGTPTRFTCQTAGRYEIVAFMSFQPSASGTLRQSRIVLMTGTTFLSVVSSPASAGHGSDQVNATVVTLAVGQWIELQLYQDSGAALGSSPTFQPSLTITKIA